MAGTQAPGSDGMNAISDSEATTALHGYAAVCADGAGIAKKRQCPTATSIPSADESESHHWQMLVQYAAETYATLGAAMMEAYDDMTQKKAMSETARLAEEEAVVAYSDCKAELEAANLVLESAKSIVADTGNTTPPHVVRRILQYS